MDRKWKPSIEIAPNCPRCASSNTKFCYYNNYSLSQPRYFCKGCRRYWTKGGSLRNVPIGGGCRKHRRSGKSVSQLVVPQLHKWISSSTTTNSGQLTSSFIHNCSVSSSSQCTNGSDIDLSVVFSKFLNSQDTKSDPAGFVPSKFSNDSIVDPAFEFSNSSINPNGYNSQNSIVCERQMHPGMLDTIPDEFHQQEGITEFLGHQPDNISCRLQDLLTDEVLLMWSISSNSHTVPDFPLTPPVTNSFDTGDPLTNCYPNALLGNWNAFDIPSYGA